MTFPEHIELIDLEHLGRKRVIGCWRVRDMLVDPGPQSCEQTLVEALGDRPPQALLLTHIHLDHAGASGALVRRWPHLQVYVHERGAPHLVDPNKLVASATRLYGEDMQRLWGEVVPIPQANVRPLQGGERIEGLEVAYVPGHAVHHVAYFDPASEYAFCGDVAGVRIMPAPLTVVPTPPPDIDIELWLASLEKLQAWQPRGLALTHFGLVDDPKEHLANLRKQIRTCAALAKDSNAAAYGQWIHKQTVASVPPELVPAYEQAAPSGQLWSGLERYWKMHSQ
jgi:glyoxylase-like metal-dependent hydrolase (beta-lactamase superfamily II)